MIGEIFGDILGSFYENYRQKKKDIDLYRRVSTFTDDSVLTCAIANHFLNNKGYEHNLRSVGRSYPTVGYGGNTIAWIYEANDAFACSPGNGAAMRVSPIAWAFETLERIQDEVEKSCVPTHNNKDAIDASKAVAASIFMARKGHSKDEIRNFVIQDFGYDLNRTVDSIRENYEWTLLAKYSIPESIVCFLESTDYEDAVRNAISLGGDADTQAGITGAIAEAYYDCIPDRIVEFCLERIDYNLMNIILNFYKKFIPYKTQLIDKLESCFTEMTSFENAEICEDYIDTMLIRSSEINDSQLISSIRHNWKHLILISNDHINEDKLGFYTTTLRKKGGIFILETSVSYDNPNLNISRSRNESYSMIEKLNLDLIESFKL